jgi:hypothetical protein
MPARGVMLGAWRLDVCLPGRWRASDALTAWRSTSVDRKLDRQWESGQSSHQSADNPAPTRPRLSARALFAGATTTGIPPAPSLFPCFAGLSFAPTGVDFHVRQPLQDVPWDNPRNAVFRNAGPAPSLEMTVRRSAVNHGFSESPLRRREDTQGQAHPRARRTSTDYRRIAARSWAQVGEPADDAR